MVFKNIAEQTYVKRTQLAPEQARIDSTLQKMPAIKSGSWGNSQAVLSMLNFKSSVSDSASDWVKVKYDSVAYQYEVNCQPWEPIFSRFVLEQTCVVACDKTHPACKP